MKIFTNFEHVIIRHVAIPRGRKPRDLSEKPERVEAAMQIVHQAYLFKERTYSNGMDYNVNYIVRKTPFEITLRRASSFFGTGQNLECSLLYHQTNKAVDSNSGPAIEYVCSPSDAPNTCAVSFRINVLSTQHSNSLFVIKFTFGNDVVLSEPIRSVSKPEQIRKKLAQCDLADMPSNEEIKSSKKRARSEELLETLAIIQQSQQEQTALLSHLLSQKPSSYSHAGSLEDNLKSLIANFEEEKADQRPSKIGRFITSLDDDKKKVLANLGHFLVNMTEPNLPLESNPPSPFSPMMEDLNILGDPFSSDYSSADEHSTKGMNEVNFPESYLNWFAI